MQRRKHQAGASMLEFVMAGIPSIFLLISILQMSMAMWSYHTMATAVRDTARYVSVRGRGCTVNGNSCSVNVGHIARKLAKSAIGLPVELMSATFITQSGQTLTCNPLSSCYANSTVWPPATNNDNTPNNVVTISAAYAFPFPAAMFWSGTKPTTVAGFTLGSTSSQRIIF